MKRFIFILISLVFSNLYGQTITCGNTSCVPSGVLATIQEKATHSAIDLGFTTTDLTVNAGTDSSTKQVRMSLSNGEFPGKNLNIELSGNANNKNSGDIYVFADNIDTLNVKLNGFNGLNGLNASQICAQRILANQYGADVRLRFLQRRVSNPSLTNDKCSTEDLRDLADNKFSCDDSAYTVLDKNDPKINVTRIRKISKCQAVVPQNVCFQKKYSVSCSFKLKIVNPLTNVTQFWDETKNYTQTLGNLFPGVFISGGSCQNYEECSNFPSCNGNDFLEKNGSIIFSNDIATTQPYEFSKNYEITQQELSGFNSQPGSNLCQKLVEADPAWSPSANNYHAYFHFHGKNNYNGGRGCYQTEPFNYKTVDVPDSNIFWESTTVSPIVAETSPGRDSSLTRLQGGTPFSASPNGNGALRQTNSAGWQLEIMPAFYQSCNPYFSFITTETSNIVKSLFDPNLFNDQSSFCINPSDSTNCSINPPYCDNPSLSINCKKVSVCEKINKKYCLDPSNPTNCSFPPFCDDPNGSNCSSDLYEKSCNPSDSANSFCDKDPNNLGQYLFIGNEPDPFKNTESYDCRNSSCISEFKTVEQTLNLDTIEPTDGQNGTLPGQGLFFIYDVRSIIQESLQGQAGSGGKSDMVSPSESRYCALKRDFTTDPNSKYENDPEITFKKVLWKALDIKGGGEPGQFPPYNSSKKIEIFKKIDPATRYLLKKELL